MPIREILKMGHPLLRQTSHAFEKNEITNQETSNLISDMIATMNEASGIGLAAPQVGVLKQLVLVGLPQEEKEHQHELLVLFNPKITILSEYEEGHWEGCLSVPGLRGLVYRPSKIQVDYLDEYANEQTKVAENFHATIFQHEIDHLHGILYIDRLEDTKQLCFNEEFEKYIVQKTD